MVKLFFSAVSQPANYYPGCLPSPWRVGLLNWSNTIIKFAAVTRERGVLKNIIIHNKSIRLFITSGHPLPSLARQLQATWPSVHPWVETETRPARLCSVLQRIRNIMNSEAQLGGPALTFPQARLETGVFSISRLPIQPQAVLREVPAEGGCGGGFQLEQNRSHSGSQL